MDTVHDDGPRYEPEPFEPGPELRAEAAQILGDMDADELLALHPIQTPDEVARFSECAESEQSRHELDAYIELEAEQRARIWEEERAAEYGRPDDADGDESEVG